jgi:hypothetical protein
MLNSTTSLLAIIVSFLALAVSALTAWFTLLRKGKIRMTQPTVIYFGPDGGPKSPPDKVFLRTLLYSTGKRGHVIENMFVRLRRGETQQHFNIWAYGDTRLSRGSGLFVPDIGYAANHHFLLPPDGTSFQFSVGQYVLEVFVTEVGSRSPGLLWTANLEITPENYRDFNQPGHGLYFDWGPDAASYFAHVRPPPAQAALPLVSHSPQWSGLTEEQTSELSATLNALGGLKMLVLPRTLPDCEDLADDIVAAALRAGWLGSEARRATYGSLGVADGVFVEPTSDEGAKVIGEVTSRLTLLLNAPARPVMIRENPSRLGEDLLIKIGRKPGV